MGNTHLEYREIPVASSVEKGIFSDNPNLHNIYTGIAANVKASNAKTVNNMVMKMYSVIFTTVASIVIASR